MTLADRSQDGRPAVVITGASSGIGAACSVRLARSGYRVFAGVRRPEDAEHLRRIAGPFCDPVLLDVANEASLREAGRRVAAMVGGQGIAALVNNAGISIPGPLEILPLED